MLPTQKAFNSFNYLEFYPGSLCYEYEKEKKTPGNSQVDLKFLKDSPFHLQTFLRNSLNEIQGGGVISSYPL